MAPPVFSDIGKSANDLLSKDFPTGSIKLEAKTTANNGVNFTVAGNKDNKSGVIAGELKSKYSDKAKGLTLTETWTTTNSLSAEVELADKITKGLKVNVLGGLLPAAGQKNAKVTLEFKQDAITTRTALDLFKGPNVAGDVVFGHRDVVVGAEGAYDVASSAITKYNFALGYNASDFSVAFTAANKLSVFSGSYFHRVNKDVEAGAKATWDRKAGPNVSLELGTKYYLDRDAFVKSKIDNNGKLGLGYTQVLRPGVKMSVGAVVDTARLGENAHKVGLSLVLES
ncbi:eukaryotic porin/Tom40 [Paraphysoderma sedebokerense]|nr:eukaryotic porin/Tom40 [Paraphysoderma sedebokerense]